MASVAKTLVSLSSVSPPQKSERSRNPSFSPLASLRPRTRRRNHLRRKFPIKTLAPAPEPATLETLRLPVLIEEEEVEEEKVETLRLPLLIEEEEVEEEKVALVSETLEPVPIPNPNPSQRSFVLDLSLRFAVLLAVQTVAAVLILGGGGKREEDGVRVLEEEKVVEEIERENVKEGTDFERRVEEIRAMARAARVQEVKELELERSEIERERVGFRRVGVGKKEGLGSRKRLEFVKPYANKKVIAAKGFNGGKVVEKDGNVGDGGKKIYFLLVR